MFIAKSTNTPASVAIVVLVVVWLLAGGLAMALYSRTLVELWIPVATCSVLSLLSGVWLWKPWQRLTDSESMLPNFICHFFFSLVIFLGFFFAANRFLASGPDYEERVRVERKYSEKKYRSRRVGRNRYARGEAYYEYYAEIRLGDGRTKQLKLPLATYNNTRSGSTMTLHLRRGFFGLPVIE